VSEAEDFLIEALRSLSDKPADSASRQAKSRYSELLSNKVAQGFAAELRRRGLQNTKPDAASEDGRLGTERRMAGGIGAKKVDVTWATEEAGLLLAISVKSINFRDAKTGNYQKNLTNRRGDMLFEAVTLHRRFPYSVLGGFFFFDQGAADDTTETRRSTFLNAHRRFQLFTGRDDPAGRDEQFERLYIALHDPDPLSPRVRIFLAGKPAEEIALAAAFEDLIDLVALRNPDHYEVVNGKLKKLRQ
jgi:hypothetical protein